jgi:hypothetical protein
MSDRLKRRLCRLFDDDLLLIILLVFLLLMDND